MWSAIQFLYCMQEPPEYGGLTDEAEFGDVSAFAFAFFFKFICDFLIFPFPSPPTGYSFCWLRTSLSFGSTEPIRNARLFLSHD